MAKLAFATGHPAGAVHGRSGQSVLRPHRAELLPALAAQTPVHLQQQRLCGVVGRQALAPHKRAQRGLPHAGMVLALLVLTDRGLDVFIDKQAT